MDNGTLLAAIDLGSNSFRLEIGRLDHGHIQRVDYLKETVRLGNGFDAQRNLSAEAMTRGLECLARFAERVTGFEKSQVRAVATQTLREAKNRDVFLQRGQEILGFPIEVIAGTEEARLIYAGVARLLPQDPEKRLVIDIGGRSTELVLGQGFAATQPASFRLGSVAWSLKYFPNGVFTEDTFHRAEIAAQAVLEEALASYPPHSWDTAYGSSGTVGAVADMLNLAGWPKGAIPIDGLDWLIRCLIRAGNAQQVRLDGLREDRRAVIGGGVSILRALMTLLGIPTVHAASGALRHGVLFEMVERDALTSDTRDVSVRRLALRFGVDAAQSERVQNVAVALLQQIFEQQPHAYDGARLVRKLGWAAQLHEVGFAISHSDHHKHGAYIVDNADMVGFSLTELHRLSLLVLGQRGKLKKLEGELEDDNIALMLMVLRLSVMLCHARKAPDHHALELRANPHKKNFSLAVPPAWLTHFPQSAHLIEQEQIAWQKMPWTFSFVTKP